MRLPGCRVILTGASGGIGQAAALALAEAGASVVLSGRDADRLERLAGSIRERGGRADVVVADLLAEEGPALLVHGALAAHPRIDVLINCAGVSRFATFEDTSPQDLQRLWASNVYAPMRLVQEVLPHMRRQGGGLIVNVGSIFGSIGFPCFAAYSATKFALRGFSEALRREVSPAGIGVLWFAPRYTRTPINRDAQQRMAVALKMNQDEPAAVAAALVEAIARNRRDRYLGMPERFFAWLNQVFPRLVDGPLVRQGQLMNRFAVEPHGPPDSPSP